MTATGFNDHQPSLDPIGLPERLPRRRAIRQGSPPMGSALSFRGEAGALSGTRLGQAGAATNASASWHVIHVRGDGRTNETAAASDDGRLRLLRQSALVALLYSSDRLCRFWFHDLRRFALFLALMRESRWLRGGERGCFLLASLAQQSQMSVARTSQILRDAAIAGDFTRCWNPRDTRYLVFDPSPAARAGLEQVVFEFCEAAAVLLDRPNPMRQLRPAASLQVYRAFIDEGLSCLSECDLDDRGTGSMTFFMAMAALALHSPIVTADFIRREAARLQVTTVTLRNVLRRAECGGWTQKADRLLVMPTTVQEHVRRVFHEVVLRLAAVLDAADAALAAQDSTVVSDERVA